MTLQDAFTACAIILYVQFFYVIKEAGGNIFFFFLL